jgi:nickel/cobalt transporter (NicO) family protein
MTSGPEEHHVVRTRLLHGARRLLLIVGLGLGALVAAAAPASAHPLGNFTVNRYARVEISAGVVRVYYVLDEAEIPAFLDRDAVAADRTGFATRRAGEILGNVRVTVDGTVLPLRLVTAELTQPPGQGNLTTLRLAILSEATLAAGSAGPQHHGVIVDSN